MSLRPAPRSFVRPSTVLALALCLLALVAPTADAQCNSAAGLVADIWEEYETRAKQAGCWAPVKGPLKYMACHADAPGKVLNVVDGMIGWWNTMAGGEWATIGPRQLGVGTEEGRLIGTSGRLFLGVAPANSAVATVRLWNDSGRSRTRVTICSHPRQGPPGVLIDEIVDPDDMSAWTWDLSGQEDRILSVRLDGRSAARHFEYRIRLDTEPQIWDYPAEGFADLHVHQAAELSGGGNWYWGDHTRPSNSQPSCRALPDLQMFLDPIPGLSLQGLHAVPVDIRTGGLSTGAGGFYHGDAGTDWPHWDDLAHQQVASDQLRAAHEAGLNLAVVSAVNNEFQCNGLKVLYPRAWDTLGCRDMEAVKRQLEAFVDFAAVHPWYEIAVDPWHARKIIHDGKLAVVVSMEVSHLFPRDEGDFIEQFDELRALGLRSVQLAHETDSRFAGAAPHRDIFEVMNWFKHPSFANLFRGQGFTFDAAGLNALGLTNDGRELVAAMVERGMLVDASHLSVNAARDLHDMLTDGGSCPWYQSHSRPVGILPAAIAARQQELVTTDEQLAQLAEVGGMVGIRTGADRMRSLDTVDGTTGGVANDCGGTSKSVAQMVGYVHRREVGVAFGSDFNGNINQAAPRFGADACFLGRNPARQAGRQAGRLGTAYDTAGLAHIGLLPDFLTDLTNLGTDGADALADSAEAFIQMWERAWSMDCKKGDGITDPVTECRSQDDCPEDLFCRVGVGERRCKEKLANGTACTAAWMCAGGSCNGVCYAANSKDFDQSCNVNGECRQGKCSAELWGVINGKCVCDADSQCAGDEFCYKGFADIGTNECRRKLADGQACLEARKCASGACNVVCYTPDSKNLGQSCNVNAECRDGKCSAALWGVANGRCVCDDDGDCASNQFCYKGFADIGTNECRAKLADGAACVEARKCVGGACNVVCYTPDSKNLGQSCNVNGECRQGKCSAELWGAVNGECVCDSDSHCTNGWCDKGVVAGIGTNSCKSLKSEGAGCSRDSQCRTGCCKFNWGRLQCRPSDKCN